MPNVRPQIGMPFAVLVEVLSDFERTGQYEAGLALLGDNWADENFLPSTDHLNSSDEAELLLRFAALIGLHLYKLESKGSQAKVKDILTRVRETFLELGDIEKAAETSAYMASAFRRSGHYSEAEIWVEDALSYDLPASSDARLFSCLIKSLILVSQKKFEQSIEFGLSVKADFRRYGDAFLNGSLCANLGVCFRLLDRFAEAMEYYSQATAYHERSGNSGHLAIVHNNVSLLHCAVGRFAAAHSAVDSAINVYRADGDKTREASSLDSKAQVYIAEHRLPEAMAVIDQSIEILRSGDEVGFLAESLSTRAKIKTMLGRTDEALVDLAEAISTTKRETGEQAAIELAADYAAAVADKKDKDEPLTPMEPVESADIELELPAPIAHYRDYKGIWINNGDLAHLGVEKGSLAIVALVEVKKGDLAAVKDRESGEIVCGLYDTDFGIVGIEIFGDGPRLFDENEVEIVGRIVGVRSSEVGPNGKYQVRPCQ